MHIVFLRGSVPPDNEHPEKLYYKGIETCEDMWTQLFHGVTQHLGASGELLYNGGSRTHVVDNSFIERWVNPLKKYKSNVKPDLIVCRGGFPYYDSFVERYPEAKKVYYGAGTRFYPQTEFNDYQLFLVDSDRQFKKIRKKGKNVKLFIKPAATLFKPVKCNKEYDICFMANASTARIKRHELLIKSFARTGYKILNIGNIDRKIVKMAENLNTDMDFSGWSLRKHLPKKISSCKVGVCCSTNYDSCPRVIPEYLACDVPIVVTDNMNFWRKKYINRETGLVVKDSELLNGVQRVIRSRLSPKNYYNENLCMDSASEYLASLIEEIM